MQTGTANWQGQNVACQGLILYSTIKFLDSLPKITEEKNHKAPLVNSLDLE